MMHSTNRKLILSLFCSVLCQHSSFSQQNKIHIIQPLALENVKIDDPFWSPKLKVYSSKTVYDVLDKLEGKYNPDRNDIIEDKKRMGRTHNALLNFDLVAQGKKDIGTHDGPPWYDGLLYETIRGASDILIEHPDKALEAKIDAYIDRIAAAQNVNPDGYINTYTTLTRSTMRWGMNGGDDNWQHDCYNAGMLVEAGIHYYNATGKTKLLTIAVKVANHMSDLMGPLPKTNIIPGHGGPEEAILKLYWLFKNKPELKSKIGLPIKEQDYFSLAKFWIENRGNHGENGDSSKRMSFKAYGQDDKSVFEQKTIEGHAVRATLTATGMTAIALENKDDRYIQAANTLWDNMIGKKLFITGGEGAIHEEEKFGPDYFLPENAYGETCAAISSGFFSARMNELQAEGKYMDEFERVLYNNMLSGVSLSGDHYHYENPLKTDGHNRWEWHSCPCCPPMILKMIGVVPEYIYAKDDKALYVNLFIGSEASIQLKNTEVLVKQTTNYPWDGKATIAVTPAKEANFTVNIRIPGWADSRENPFQLYHSQTNEPISLKVNGKVIAVKPVNGYVAINRKWKRGDIVELILPVKPRVITVNNAVQSIKGKLAIASGPIVYGFESIDNPSLSDYQITPATPLTMTYEANLLNGVNTITGQAITTTGQTFTFKAIPFYALGNRAASSSYQVWVPKKTDEAQK